MGSRSSKSRSSISPQEGPSNTSSFKSSIKGKAIEEKIKVTELVVESNFTEQKLKMEYLWDKETGNGRRGNWSSSRSQGTGSFGFACPHLNVGKYHYSDSLFKNGEPNYTASDHEPVWGSLKNVLPVTYLSRRGAGYWCFFRGSSRILLLRGNIQEVVEKRIEGRRRRKTHKRLIRYTLVRGKRFN